MAERMRLRRWEGISRAFPDLDQMRILDLGGTPVFWRRAPVRPASVTVINMAEPDESLPWVTAIDGDACDARRLVGDAEFDLVFSNSLIEHLGGHAIRLAFADVVRTMAPHYIVQTPYRYFPIEPHWLFPGMQFLPVSARAWLAPKWSLGMTHGWPADQARREVLYTELLTMTEMRDYFPDARFEWERFVGLPKSMTGLR